jgi:hypothetical protein
VANALLDLFQGAIHDWALQIHIFTKERVHSWDVCHHKAVQDVSSVIRGNLVTIAKSVKYSQDFETDINERVRGAGCA